MEKIYGTRIFDYIFGNQNGQAGIAFISGDAGTIVDYNISQSDFECIVESALENEHEDRDKDVAEMQTKFAEEMTRTWLYNWFRGLEAKAGYIGIDSDKLIWGVAKTVLGCKRDVSKYRDGDLTDIDYFRATAAAINAVKKHGPDAQITFGSRECWLTIAD